jgi:uncharacterized protein (UPF0212 family)
MSKEEEYVLKVEEEGVDVKKIDCWEITCPKCGREFVCDVLKVSFGRESIFGVEGATVERETVSGEAICPKCKRRIPVRITRIPR